jgi:murein hydrolase activator
MGMAGVRHWTATISAPIAAVGLLAALAVPLWAGNPEPSEAEADIELKTITRQLEQARQQEQAIEGRLTALESEAAAVSRSLAETAARIQSREAMVTAGEDQLQQMETEEQRAARRHRATPRVARRAAGGAATAGSEPAAAIRHAARRCIVGAARGHAVRRHRAGARGRDRSARPPAGAHREFARRPAPTSSASLTRHLDSLAGARAELKDLHSRKLALMAETRDRLEAERRRSQELAARAMTLRELLDGVAEERRRDEAKQRSAEEETERRRQDLLNRPRTAFTEMQGQIKFPAQGERLREYGEGDGFGGHSKGLYIATRKLAQVTAPADADIEFAGEFRSYGQLLILNVGEGYHVLLAGLGRITAEAGQTMRAGEPVGSMGEAPARGTLIGDRLDDPRPILYVEFRKDGSAIDPSAWWFGSRKEARR